MKNSFALALGLVVVLSSNLVWQPAFGQQVQYPQAFPGQYASPEQYQAAQQYAAAQQAQQYAGQAGMQGWPQQPAMQQQGMQQQGMQQQGMQQPLQAQQPAYDTNRPPAQPSQYEQQEQAIQKGLAENRVNGTVNESYNRGGNNDWDTSTTAPTPSHSKLRGAAGTATKVLAKTAAVALPTVGLIFLTRALNRNSGYGGMGNSMGSGMGMGNGMGGYPYQGSGYMPGYGQQPYGNYNGW